MGSAPQLRQRIFKVSSANRFETVVAFLTKKLAAAAAATTAGGGGAGGGGGGGEQPATAAGGGVGGQVFCYVNSVFAPGLDEGVGGLWRVSNFFLSFRLPTVLLWGLIVGSGEINPLGFSLE